MLTRKSLIVVYCDQCGEDIIIPEGDFVSGTLLGNWVHVSRHSTAAHDLGDEYDFCSLDCLRIFLINQKRDKDLETEIKVNDDS